MILREGKYVFEGRNNILEKMYVFGHEKRALWVKEFEKDRPTWLCFCVG